MKKIRLTRIIQILINDYDLTIDSEMEIEFESGNSFWINFNAFVDKDFILFYKDLMTKSTIELKVVFDTGLVFIIKDATQIDDKKIKFKAFDKNDISVVKNFIFTGIINKIEGNK